MVPWCTCGDQRTGRSQFSPSTLCVLKQHRWLYLLSHFIGPREFVAGAEANAADLVPHSGTTDKSRSALLAVQQALWTVQKVLRRWSLKV